MWVVINGRKESSRERSMTYLVCGHLSRYWDVTAATHCGAMVTGSGACKVGGMGQIVGSRGGVIRKVGVFLLFSF